MNIGLFGGSFNPLHLAHLIVAETVRDRLDLDRIWWIPAAVPPHKKNEHRMAAPEHRLAMTRRATDDNDRFSVCDIEIKRQGVSYTVDTVRLLQEEYAGYSFSLILGGDMFVDFASWRRPDEIIECVPLVIYPRPGANLEEVPERYMKRARLIDTPLVGISGTTIRRRIRQGRSCRYLVPDAVLDYIKRHRLYVE